MVYLMYEIKKEEKKKPAVTGYQTQGLWLLQTLYLIFMSSHHA